MSKQALFIKHKAKPGKRNDVRRIWEKYVPAYVDESSLQPAYFYCFDNTDPDVIVVFQLQAGPNSGADFMNQPWYQEYEKATADLLAEPSEFRSATPQWVKMAS